MSPFLRRPPAIARPVSPPPFAPRARPLAPPFRPSSLQTSPLHCPGAPAGRGARRARAGRGGARGRAAPASVAVAFPGPGGGRRGRRAGRRAGEVGRRGGRRGMRTEGLHLLELVEGLVVRVQVRLDPAARAAAAGLRLARVPPQLAEQAVAHPHRAARREAAPRARRGSGSTLKALPRAKGRLGPGSAPGGSRAGPAAAGPGPPPAPAAPPRRAPPRPRPPAGPPRRGGGSLLGLGLLWCPGCCVCVGRSASVWGAKGCVYHREARRGERAGGLLGPGVGRARTPVQP